MKNTRALKKELYNRVRLQISDLLGRQDGEIKRSEKALARLFAQKWSKAKPAAFKNALLESDWVFWGDFHGVRQSQKAMLRWLSEMEKTQDLKICLALECLPSSCQKWLDQYLNGELSQREFLSKVKWSRIWGFPFEHYRPLLEWARSHKQPVLAVNAPIRHATLAQREKWAVEILEGYHAKKPDHKIWILYGEYHLLPQHFQKRTPKSLKSLFVLQNSDRLYFDRPGSINREEIFKGPKHYYCLQNMPPWVKWQTYLLFLDHKEDQEIEEGLELTDHVLGWARVLALELGMALNENEFNVYTSDEAALWEKLKDEGREIQHLFENFLGEGLSFVSPRQGWAYLSRISVNEAASLAMQMLYFQQSPGIRWPFVKQHYYWERLIWILAISYFGSKIINPHRKSPNLEELQKKVRSSSRPFERQAARLVVGYVLRKTLGGRGELFDKTPSERVRFLAAKWLAGIWGESLYNAYHQKRLSPENLKSFLSKDPNQENFDVVLQDLQEMF